MRAYKVLSQVGRKTIQSTINAISDEAALTAARRRFGDDVLEVFVEGRPIVATVTDEVQASAA